MSSPESKAELSFESGNAADFFRDFAEALASGDDHALEKWGISIQNSRKIKLEMKRDSDAISLKIKSTPQNSGKEKVSEEASAATFAGKTGYNPLKKRMEKSFKNIKKSLQSGILPAEEDISSFLEDSAMMVNFPGYGDEYYAEYMNACKTFRKAMTEKDIEQLRNTLIEISELKSACHDRYK